MKIKKTENGYIIELENKEFLNLKEAFDDFPLYGTDLYWRFVDAYVKSLIDYEVENLKVDGYKVVIEDYDLWKGKINNLYIRSWLKAKDMISLYQQTKQVMIVGADIVDNEGWEIRIYPDEKIITCKFYKN